MFCAMWPRAVHGKVLNSPTAAAAAAAAHGGPLRFYCVINGFIWGYKIMVAAPARSAPLLRNFRCGLSLCKNLSMRYFYCYANERERISPCSREYSSNTYIR